MHAWSHAALSENHKSVPILDPGQASKARTTLETNKITALGQNPPYRFNEFYSNVAKV